VHWRAGGAAAGGQAAAGGDAAGRGAGSRLCSGYVCCATRALSEPALRRRRDLRAHEGCSAASTAECWAAVRWKPMTERRCDRSSHSRCTRSSPAGGAPRRSRRRQRGRRCSWTAPSAGRGCACPTPQRCCGSPRASAPPPPQGALASCGGSDRSQTAFISQPTRVTSRVKQYRLVPSCSPCRHDIETSSRQGSAVPGVVFAWYTP
jgi:hypothetical protein